METSNLRQLLKSLCSNTPWRYAIFWNLEDQSQKILTWEDGFYDYSESKEPTQTLSDGIFKKSEIFSANCERSTCNRSSNGDPIFLALTSMLCCQYTFGEGPLGRVAHTGLHFWVLYNGALGDDFNADFLTEYPNEWLLQISAGIKYPDEWLLQFSAGIKTILLVPVVPHAVVQLGSVHAIPEDLVLVNYIKERFSALHAWPSSLPVESLDMRPPTSRSLQDILNVKDEVYANSEPAIASMSISNQTTWPFLCDDVLFEKVLDNSPRENKTGVLSMGPTQASLAPNNSINALDLEIMDSDTFRSSCVDEDLHVFSQFYNSRVDGEPLCGNLDFYSIGEMMEEPYINQEDSEVISNSWKFPLDCELHKALVPDISRQINECLWDSLASGEDVYNGSGLICSKDFIGGVQPLSWESSAWFTEESDAQQLLEAVGASTYNMLDDAKPDESNNVWPSPAFEQFNASSQVCCQTEGTPFLGEDCVPQNQEEPALVAGNRNTYSDSSNSASSRKSMMSSSLIDEEPRKKCRGFEQSKRLCHGSQRKFKSGNNHRARPRDRQLIQDRIKELRELVPDGAKCSIDSLLDQAIKHMLFLGNVMVQAEKLRKWVDEEVPSLRKRISSKAGDGFKNGVSWAFEFEREVEACPILVEDLEIHGHLLIEMVCSHYGLFLEITQAIHGLELTILKGTMEKRTDNTWACFIVEVQASKGFHRVNIFWPLMRLLQRAKNSISSNP